MAVNSRLVAKIEAEEPTQRLAVLIDADNAQASIIEGLLAEIARFGEATVKRIYGDFTAASSASWKKVLNTHAIKPVQQYAYTTGKNATDSMLIIDAMDLLYTRRFQGFCLVSSDSDFTGLAIRIREEGLAVYGFGERKTPEAFRNACHKFIFTEVLRPVVEAATPPESAQPQSMPVEANRETSVVPQSMPVVANRETSVVPQSMPVEANQETPVVPRAQSLLENTFPHAFFRQALEQAGDESGWVSLAQFGSHVSKLRPDFDPRNYGYKKLSDLVKAHPEVFFVEERKLGANDARIPYIRPTEIKGKQRK